MVQQSDSECIETAWWAGVQAVQGRLAVEQALSAMRLAEPVSVLAIGKAAASMAEGVLCAGLSVESGLVITKYHHSLAAVDNHSRFSVLESAHPVPDAASVRAGEAALAFVQQTQHTLVLLVSGGASALCEAPAEGWDLASIQASTARLLASGATIAEINAQRAQQSRVKAGNLLRHYRGQRVLVLAISDVANDDIALIGSGIGACPPAAPFDYQLQLVGSNALARQAVVKQLEASGVQVVENSECLYGELSVLTRQLVKRLKRGPRGAYVFGGEPTVMLPDNPGEGGRNQSLALALDAALGGLSLLGLVAGTDGTDGPTTAAGGWFSGESLSLEDQIDAEKALAAANAGPELCLRSALFSTGPTGTNVMDIVIAIKR